MNETPDLENLFHFLRCSPTAFHATRMAAGLLLDNGFTELAENAPWEITSPGSYFVRRNGSSLIAFTLSGDTFCDSRLRLAGAHTDSPGLKVKPSPAASNHGLLQLGVETYGGALLGPWFDRDLSLAGRITIQQQGSGGKTLLLDFKQPIAVIPSLAIHLDREANEKKKINRQTDLVPVLMSVGEEQPPSFSSLLQQQLESEHGISQAEILDHELFFYDVQPPAKVGLNGEFITGPRLDNLVSCFSLITALLDTRQQQNSLVILNDHEEVGSLSASGAQGPFLRATLERLIPDHEERQRCLQNSVMLSVDNAHAVHPNFSDRYDANHLPGLNRGPVIKYNANQRYATTSRTASFYRLLSRQAEVPIQEFVMRSDLACGSTIGPLTAGSIGVQTIDIGVPSLAMHSIREMAGARDISHLSQVLHTYFTLPPDDPTWQCLS